MIDTVVVGGMMGAIGAMATGMVAMFRMLNEVKKSDAECQQKHAATAVQLANLQEMLGRFTDLGMLGPTFITATMPDMTITEASGTVEAMFGWAPHELIGRNVSLLIPNEFQQRHEMAVKRAADTGEVRPGAIGIQAFGRHKKEHTFPVVVVLSEKSRKPLLVQAQINYRRV